MEIYGDRTEEISVEIDPEAIASYNLTVTDISRQIQRRDSKVTAGLLRNDRYDLLIEVAGELDTLQRVWNIPLSFGSQSQFIRIQDVAKVTKGLSSFASELSIISDRPGVTLAVHSESSTSY